MKLFASIPVKNLLLPTSETRATHLYVHLIKDGSHVDGSDQFVPISGDVVNANLGDHPDSVYVLEYQARTAEGGGVSATMQAEVSPHPTPEQLG
jgi:hypothetical protein